MTTTMYMELQKSMHDLHERGAVIFKQIAELEQHQNQQYEQLVAILAQKEQFSATSAQIEQIEWLLQHQYQLQLQLSAILAQNERFSAISAQIEHERQQQHLQQKQQLWELGHNACYVELQQSKQQHRQQEMQAEQQRLKETVESLWRLCQQWQQCKTAGAEAAVRSSSSVRNVYVRQNSLIARTRL